MSNIYTLIPKIMASVGAIEKGRKNQQQGYAFRGIDDAYQAFQKPLSEHGVFVVPEVLDVTREDRQTKSGGGLIYTTMKVRHTFFAPDGSNVVAVTVGEAMDSGDKSSNKAMSAAMKYALLEVFCVPTEGDNDTENHSHDVAPKTRPSASHNATPSQTQPQPAKTPPSSNSGAAKPIVASDKTRSWMTGELEKGETPETVKEFFVRAGVILETENLADIPLRWVATSKEQLAQVIAAIGRFTDGEEAKMPYAAGAIDAPPVAPKVETVKIDPAWLVLKGTVELVSEKSGTSTKGVAWTRWGVKVGGEFHTTFSQTLGALANASKGKAVTLYYTENDKGRNLQHMEVA
jgi:hypothetical protein